jgi:hypothetical protein
MRVSINHHDRTAKIEFNTDEESELVEESLNLLISRQNRIVSLDRTDLKEQEALERFKITKKKAVDETKARKKMYSDLKDRLKKDKEEKIKQLDKQKRLNNDLVDDDPGDINDDDINIHIQGTEIEDRNIYDIINALNENIASLEVDGTYKTTNEQKYRKLQKLMEQAQQSKSMFERQTPKPRNFGRLRK